MIRVSVILLVLVSLGALIGFAALDEPPTEVLLEDSSAPPPRVVAPAEPNVDPIAIPSSVAPKPGTVSGRVFDRGEVPLAGARVRIRLWTPPGRRNFALTAGYDETVEADEEGEFSAQVPGGGVYRVTASAEGYAARRLEGVEPGNVLEFHLPAGGILVGSVVKDRDGAPLEGAVLTGTTAAGTEVKAQSAVDGTFVFRDLPAGVLRVDADHPLHIYASGIEVAIEEAGRHALEIRLEEGKAVFGRVVETGVEMPVARAMVSHGKRKTRTDEAGRYRLEGLPKDRITVLATAPGFLQAQVKVNLAGSREEAEVDFALRPGAELRGTVLDEDYRPVEDARVRLYLMWRGGWGAGGWQWEAPSSSRTEITTDAEGRFRIRGISPQSWSRFRVEAEVPGYPVASRGDIQIKRADDLVTVELVLGGGGAAIGTVVDAEGRPISGARVSLAKQNQWGGGAAELVCGTDSEGAFRFGGLAEATYRLRVDAQGQPPATRSGIQVRVDGEKDVGEVKLEEGRSVKGLVHDKDEKPVEGATVTLRSKSSVGTATTDAAGHFEVACIAEGPYRVKASCSGYAGHSSRKVTPDPVDGILIEMRPQPFLRGRVRDAVTGEPVARFRIRATREGDRPGRPRTGYDRTLSAADGTFAVQIDPGQWDLRVEAKGYVAFETKTPELTLEDEAEPIDVVLGSGAALEGYVHGQDGRPLRGANVYQKSRDDEDGHVSVGETERDGYFYVGDLEGGLHGLIVRAHGYPIYEIQGLLIPKAGIARHDVNLSRFTRLALKLRVEREGESPAAGSSRRRRRTRARVVITSLDRQPVGLTRKSRRAGRRTYVPTSKKSAPLRESRPLNLVDLHAGRYRVRVTLKGYPPQERVVTLDFGVPRTEEFAFTKSGEPTPGPR